MFPMPGDEALVHERLSDQARLIGAPKAGDDRGRVRLGREQIGSELSNASGAEREHRAVPLGRLPLPRAQDEPRRPALRRSSALPDAPAPGHAQVAADDDVSLEP